MTNIIQERKHKSVLNAIEAAALDAGKKPPQSVDMEEAVLGALMLEKNAVIDIQGLLKPESFYVEANQKVYKAIVDLSGKHEIFSPSPTS